MLRTTSADFRERICDTTRRGEKQMINGMMSSVAQWREKIGPPRENRTKNYKQEQKPVEIRVLMNQSEVFSLGVAKSERGRRKRWSNKAILKTGEMMRCISRVPSKKKQENKSKRKKHSNAWRLLVTRDPEFESLGFDFESQDQVYQSGRYVPQARFCIKE